MFQSTLLAVRITKHEFLRGFSFFCNVSRLIWMCQGYRHRRLDLTVFYALYFTVFTVFYAFKQWSKWADMSYGLYIITMLLKTSKVHTEVFQAGVARWMGVRNSRLLIWQSYLKLYKPSVIHVSKAKYIMNSHLEIFCVQFKEHVRVAGMSFQRPHKLNPHCNPLCWLWCDQGGKVPLHIISSFQIQAKISAHLNFKSCSFTTENSNTREVCATMTSEKKKKMKIHNNLKEISYITEDKENWK